MKIIKYSLLLTSFFMHCLYSASIKNEELSSQDVQALKLIGAMQECLKLSEQTSLNYLQNNNLQKNDIKNQFITYLESYITTFGQLSEKQGGFLQGYKNSYYLGSNKLVDQPITPLEYVVLLNTLEKASKNIHWQNAIQLTLLVNKNGINREQKFTIDEIIIAIRNIPLPSFYSMSNILMTAGAVAAIAGGAYIAYNLATNKDFQLFGYDNPFLEKSTNDIDPILSKDKSILSITTPDQSAQPDQEVDNASTSTHLTSTPHQADQLLQSDDSSNDTSTNTDATSSPTLNDQSLQSDQKADNAIPMQELQESDDTTPMEQLQDFADTTPTAHAHNESDQPIDDADDTSSVQEQQDTNWLSKHKGKIAIGATALAMATPQGRTQVKKITTKAKPIVDEIKKRTQQEISNLKSNIARQKEKEALEKAQREGRSLKNAKLNKKELQTVYETGELRGKRVKGDIYQNINDGKAMSLEQFKNQYKHATQDKNKAAMKYLEALEELNVVNNPDAYRWKHITKEAPTQLEIDHQAQIVAAAKKDLVRASSRVNKEAKNYKENIDMLKQDIKDYGYFTE